MAMPVDSTQKMVRVAIVVELTAHFLHNVMHVALFVSPTALAGILFWALVLCIEAKHLAASGRGQALLDVLDSLLEVFVSLLKLLDGLLKTAVYYLKKAAVAVKTHCDQLQADIELMYAAGRLQVAEPNVVDVEAKVVKPEVVQRKSRQRTNYK